MSLVTKPNKTQWSRVNWWGHLSRRHPYHDEPPMEDSDYGILPVGVAAAIDSLSTLSFEEVQTVLRIARSGERWDGAEGKISTPQGS